MYQKPFYIEKPVWNNALSFEKRKIKKLYVPNIIDWKIDDIELWTEIAFSDFDFEWNLIEAKWLKNFYKINWKWKNVYLFDNHNHAFYFWYLEKFENNIWNGNMLFHVDEHSDMRDPWVYLKENYTLEDVFNYTNFELNVWNYIIPALNDGFIKDVFQIRNEFNLNDYLYSNKWFKNWKFEFNSKTFSGAILNLDLDFFEPWLDYIDYELKKKVVLDIASKSRFIIVCTSPFFIDQKLAIDVFKDLFK